jgi:hypothetical protein
LGNASRLPIVQVSMITDVFPLSLGKFSPDLGLEFPSI